MTDGVLQSVYDYRISKVRKLRKRLEEAEQLAMEAHQEILSEQIQSGDIKPKGVLSFVKFLVWGL